MNPATNRNPAFRERAQRHRNELADRCKNNHGIEFFRRHFIGTAGPDRAQLPRCLLCCLVARASEREKLAALVKRNLRDQARGVTETINAETARIASLAQRSITDQSCAKQRRNIDVIILNEQTKTES